MLIREKIPAIQSLRGIAVIAVLFFHLGLLPGGFVGVDIFFIISGYLISKILVGSDILQPKAIMSFIKRRAMRLVPAAALMTSAVTFFGIFLLPPDIQMDTWVTSLSHLAIAANLPISVQLGSYFSGAKEFYPLMHMWSLSVEEQLYLGFLLAVILSALLSKLVFRRNFLTLIMLGVSIFSFFAFAIGPILQGFAYAGFVSYFSPVIRVWQFGLGFAVYILTRNNTANFMKPSAPLISLGFFSLFALILSSISGLNTGWQWVAVVSMVSAILLAGVGLSTKSWRIKPLEWIGDRSYGIYLWHWPIISLFLRSQNAQSLDGFGQQLAIAFASLFFGHLSYELVEKKFHHRNPILSARGKRNFTLLLLSGFVLSHSLALMSVEYKRETLNDHTFAEVDLSQCHQRLLKEACMTSVGGGAIGDRLVLIGDSNAKMVAPAFQSSALQLPISSFVAKTAPGCSGTAWSLNLDDSPDSCEGYYSWVREQAAMANTTFVLVLSSSGWFQEDNFGSSSWDETDLKKSKKFSNVIDFVSLANKNGNEVIFVEPIPKLRGTDWHIDACSFTGALQKSCSQGVPLATSIADRFQLLSALERTGVVETINIDALVCPNSYCSSWDEDGYLVFRNAGHLEPSYLLKHSDRIAEILSQDLAN